MKNLRILGLILVLSLSKNVLTMRPEASKSEQPKKQVPAKASKKEKFESKDLEGKDYISGLPDEIILEIVLKLLRQNQIKDAINFLSTNRKFRKIHNDLMNADIKQITGIKKDIVQLIKDWKTIRDSSDLPGNDEYDDMQLAIKNGLIIWIKNYIGIISDLDKTHALASLIRDLRYLAMNWDVFKDDPEKLKLVDNYLKIIQILVDNGANVNEEIILPIELGRKTSLRFLGASLYGFEDIQSYQIDIAGLEPILFQLAKILLEHGAKIDIRTENIMKHNPKVKKFIEDYLASKQESGKQE